MSPDGSAWSDAPTVDRAAGIIDQPRCPRFKAYTIHDKFFTLSVWAKIGVNTVASSDQGASDLATNLLAAQVAGTRLFGQAS